MIPAPRGARDDGTWHHAWERALGELELDVHDAEQMLVLAHQDSPAEVALRRAAWTPPEGLGPLPAPLHQRAQALLERQLEVTRRTAEAISLGRRQASLAQTLRVMEASAPVYIDTES